MTDLPVTRDITSLEHGHVAGCAGASGNQQRCSRSRVSASPMSAHERDNRGLVGFPGGLETVEPTLIPVVACRRGGGHEQDIARSAAPVEKCAGHRGAGRCRWQRAHPDQLPPPAPAETAELGASSTAVRQP